MLTLSVAYSLHADEVSPSRYFTSSAVLLRLDEGRLYLWVDTPMQIDSEFTVTVSDGQGEFLSTSIEKCMGKIAVTDKISDSLVARLQAPGNPEITIFLSSDRISDDTLFVGVPAAFRRSYNSSKSGSMSLPVTSETVFYDNLKDAEIDLAVGDLDLLLIPSTEVDADLMCNYNIYPSASQVSVYFLLDLPDYDLLPAALSYCIKGMFADADSELVSEVIMPQDLRKYYPRKKRDAASLFAQLPDTARASRCCFQSTSEFPGMLVMIEQEVRVCGGEIAFRNSESPGPLNLEVSAVTGQDSTTARWNACRELVQRAGELDLSWSRDAARIIDKAAAGTESDRIKAINDLSRMLASDLRLIPLGNMHLVIVAGQDVRCVRRIGAPAKIVDFYLVTRP
jgi:hypothetical protein